MNNNSRIKNTIYNFISSIGGQILTVFVQFIVRTVFIYTLGKSYLGIEGLLSNILLMLSISEFGIGSAIIYRMYKPINENDTYRLTTLINFYKKAYFVIGLFIAIVGFLLIPILHLIIKDYDKISELGVNISIIFLLYLTRTVSSYWFFAYKSTVIKANQKEYIIKIISYLFTSIIAVTQIIFLFILHSFIIYVAISVIGMILQNLVCAKYADHMYPYINNNYHGKISKVEFKDIIKDCGALALYRINDVVYLAIDNIILSIYLGIESVALYANYFIFYTVLNTFFNNITNSMTHSLGSLHVTKKIDHEYLIFKSMNLITSILGGLSFAGIFIVSTNFIQIWIGSDWVLEQPFTFLLGIELYMLSLRVLFGKYRSAMGLFRQSKYRPIISVFAKLLFSILFVIKFGVCGIVLGTILADLTTCIWLDPLIVHKYGFMRKYKVSAYYLTQFKYFIICILTAFFNYIICYNLPINSKIFTMLISCILIFITIPTVLVFFSYKSPELDYVFSIIRNKFRFFFKQQS